MFPLSSIGLYIHWPFCLSKCPYCDFNSHVRENIDTDQWLNSYLQELDHYFSLIDNRKVGSIFIGGGTPSLMPPSLVQKLLEWVKQNNLAAFNNLEITMEANPTSVEKEKLYSFNEAGVNRLSLGIQSLRHDHLKFLGRQHSVREALEALETARNIFPRFSCDLIYALPNQSIQDWEEDLKKVMMFSPQHLSLYQLTIEPNTAFATRYKRGDFSLPSEELSADFFELTADITKSRSYHHYEISNYAKDNFSCIHNLHYWSYNDYVGIGPGAHGRVTLKGQKHAAYNLKAPEIWLDGVKENGHGIKTLTPLSFQDQFYEYLLMNLRKHDGFTFQDFTNKFDRNIYDHLNQENLDPLVEDQFLSIDNTSLKASFKGRLNLESVLYQMIK